MIDLFSYMFHPFHSLQDQGHFPNFISFQDVEWKHCRAQAKTKVESYGKKGASRNGRSDNGAIKDGQGKSLCLVLFPVRIDLFNSIILSPRAPMVPTDLLKDGQNV